MSSTIRIRAFLPLLAALAVLGCQRGDSAGKSASDGGASPSQTATVAPLPPAGAGAGAPEKAGIGLDDVVLQRENIAVNGEPACALTVRYPDSEDQPVTWNGEGCDDVEMALMAIEDLKALGQDGKLGEDARDDLAGMPGRQALYIEGGFSSSLYPQNVMGRIYEIPLAD